MLLQTNEQNVTTWPVVNIYSNYASSCVINIMVAISGIWRHIVARVPVQWLHFCGSALKKDMAQSSKIWVTVHKLHGSTSKNTTQFWHSLPLKPQISYVLILLAQCTVIQNMYKFCVSCINWPSILTYLTKNKSRNHCFKAIFKERLIWILLTVIPYIHSDVTICQRYKHSVVQVTEMGINSLLTQNSEQYLCRI